MIRQCPQCLKSFDDAIPATASAGPCPSCRRRIDAWIEGESKTGVAQSLIAVLRDGGQDARKAAAETLGMLGNPMAVEPLVQALSGRGEVFIVAAEALARIGDIRAVPALLAVLEDETQWYLWRAVAAKALGRLRDPRALEPLVRALGHKEDGLRHDAAGGLGDLADEGAVEPLVMALTDPEAHVRFSSVVSLGSIAQTGSARAVAALKSALRDPDASVRDHASSVLADVSAKVPVSSPTQPVVERPAGPAVMSACSFCNGTGQLISRGECQWCTILYPAPEPSILYKCYTLHCQPNLDDLLAKAPNPAVERLVIARRMQLYCGLNDLAGYVRQHPDDESPWHGSLPPELADLAKPLLCIPDRGVRLIMLRLHAEEWTRRHDTYLDRIVELGPGGRSTVYIEAVPAVAVPEVAVQGAQLAADLGRGVSMQELRRLCEQYVEAAVAYRGENAQLQEDLARNERYQAAQQGGTPSPLLEQASVLVGAGGVDGRWYSGMIDKVFGSFEGVIERDRKDVARAVEELNKADAALTRWAETNEALLLSHVEVLTQLLRDAVPAQLVVIAYEQWRRGAVMDVDTRSLLLRALLPLARIRLGAQFADKLRRMLDARLEYPPRGFGWLLRRTISWLCRSHASD